MTPSPKQAAAGTAGPPERRSAEPDLPQATSPEPVADAVDGAMPPSGPALTADAEELVLYQMPGHLIRRLQQVAVSLFIDEIEPDSGDITPVQYAALMAIQTYPEIDQAQLAGVIAYDRTTIGGVVDRLQAKGLVRRTVSPSDRRLRQLLVEPAGQAMLERMAQAVARAQARIVEPLAPGERETFVRLLSKLVAANNERSRAPMRPVKRRSVRASRRGKV